MPGCLLSSVTFYSEFSANNKQRLAGFCDVVVLRYVVFFIHLYFYFIFDFVQFLHFRLPFVNFPFLFFSEILPIDRPKIVFQYLS